AARGGWTGPAPPPRRAALVHDRSRRRPADPAGRHARPAWGALRPRHGRTGADRGSGHRPHTPVRARAARGHRGSIYRPPAGRAASRGSADRRRKCGTDQPSEGPAGTERPSPGRHSVTHRDGHRGGPDAAARGRPAHAASVAGAGGNGAGRRSKWYGGAGRQWASGFRSQRSWRQWARRHWARRHRSTDSHGFFPGMTVAEPARGHSTLSAAWLGIRMMFRSPRLASVMLLATLVQGVLQGLLVYLLREVLQGFDQEAHVTLTGLFAGAMVVFAAWLLRAASSAGAWLMAWKLAYSVETQSLNAIVAKLLTLPVRFFDRNRQGDLVLASYHDLLAVRQLTLDIGMLVDH